MGWLGLDKGRKGNVYMKLFLHFSVFSTHVLGFFFFFFNQIWDSYLKLSHLKGFEFFFFLFFITSYSVLHSKNIAISAIEELAVKLRQHGKRIPCLKFLKKKKENCIHVEGQEIVFTSCIKEKWGKVKKCFPPLHPYPSKSWKGLAGDCGGSSGAQWLLLLGVLCSQRGWGGGVVICPQRCSHFLA